MITLETLSLAAAVATEQKRRLDILSVLYEQRRKDPEHPGMSPLQLETAVGVPREQLTFTLWYLKEKLCIERDDNMSYFLTATGMDYVEARTQPD